MMYINLVPSSDDNSFDKDELTGSSSLEDSTDSPDGTSTLNIGSESFQGLTSLAQIDDALKASASVAGSPIKRERLIVKFKSNILPSDIEKIKDGLGVTSSRTVRSTGAQIWDLPSAASVDNALSIYGNGKNPIFEYIERDSVVRLSAPVFQKPDPVTSPGVKPAAIPNDPSFSQLWGLNNTGQNGGTVDADIDAPEAWNIETGNPNLVIGVIDTGVDYNHPDLVGNIWSNPGETIDGLDNDNNGYIDDIRGWDFAYGDNNPMDVDGHGTHVSGTIAGRGNNGVGVAGVTWNAKIMPIKFLDDSGSGFTSDAILAVDYATNKGVKITNNSWGGGGYSQGLYDAINAAGQAGSLFIAAAGNNSANADINPMYPAAYDLANIISVASTTRTDGLSSFSNYGLTSVDLGAPGSEIYSTTPNNSYATYSGTSMASPHVAGAAALLWSEYPGRTAQQIKNTLMQSGDSIAALAGRTVSGKRLNIYNALGSGTLPAVSVTVSPATVQEDGATNLVYTFTRSNLGLSSPLTVNFGASGTANATLIGSDPADYSVLTNSSVTFNPATRTGTVTFAAGATTAQVVVDPIADTRPEVANETVALVVNSGTGYIGGTPGSATGTIVSEEALPIFTNPAPINIPSSGSGTPYPSTITVAGQSGNLSGLKVTLTGINHTWPDDIDVLLVGPNGAKAILMSDVGSFNDISNVTLTFDAAASSSLPDEGQIVSGAYKPTDFESGDLFASPAPPGPYSTNFSGFYNASPNGIWSLYVTDDVGGDAGSFAGGWSIELQSGPALPLVTVAATDASAAETLTGTTPNPGRFTLTRTGATTSALTVNVAMSGTATNGTDYTSIPATATFAAGSATAVVNLNVIDDALAEGTETATLTVLPGSGYTVGSIRNSSSSPAGPTGGPAGTGSTVTSSATVSIADNEPPLTVITLNAVDTGWYNSTGFHDSTNPNYITGDTTGPLYRNWFAFNLPTLTQPIVSAQLRVNTFEYTSPAASETYELREVATAVPTLRAGGSGQTGIYADLGDGAIYGNRTFTNANDNQPVTINLNAAAISALTSKSGQAFALGGLLTTLDTIPNDEYVFGFSNNPVPGDVQLILNTGGSTLPVVTVAATDASAAETLPGTTPNPGRFTLTLTGATTSALTVNVAKSGTATNGTDYTSIPATATFAVGSATALVNLNVIDDALAEGTENAILTVTSGTGYTVGSTSAATVAIADNEPVVTIAATDASAAETLTGTTPNPGRFTLTRTGALTNALTVNLQRLGTATNGTDYTSIPATATFAAGSATALVNLNVIDDALIEGPESAILTVATGTGYLVGANSAATVTIVDNDGATPAPVVTITATDPLAGETAVGVTPNPGQFTLTRTGATTSALTVNLVRSGTATNGTDYTSIPLTATFAAGSSTALVGVSVIDDTLIEGPETATLTVTTYGVGVYSVGAASTATVTILDNDVLSGRGSALPVNNGVSSLSNLSYGLTA